MIYKRILVFFLMLFLLQFSVFPKTGYSLTIKEEEEMGEEFLKHIKKIATFIHDPLLVNYIREVGDKIVSTIPFKPFDFNFYLIEDRRYNAFAAPGGHIFLNAGLFEAMDSEEDLAGILGHEIAHVTCRHISEKLIKQKKIQVATLAGMAAGILLGSSGNSETASALIHSSVAAGISASLAYSREDEKQADQIGLGYLRNAGYTGVGLINSLKKIREKQWITPDEIPTYLTTHPAVDERIVYLSGAVKESDRISDVKESEFEMAHTRLIAMYGDKTMSEKRIESKLRKNPNNPSANYGYAIILERRGKKKEAISYLKKAISEKPFDSYILKEYGSLLFDIGDYKEADKVMEGLETMLPDDPDVLFYLGRSKLILNKTEEGVDILKRLTAGYPEYGYAFYYLAKGYGELGAISYSHYNLGIHYENQRDIKTAIFHFKKALDTAEEPEKKREIEQRLDKLTSRRIIY